MIVNRRTASLWRWLSASNAPGLQVDPNVALGIQLADASEHGPPNLGIRGAATGLVAAFGTFATWQLTSTAPGGILVSRIGASNTLVGEQIGIFRSAVKLGITGATVSDTINRGIGEANSTLEQGANAGSVATPTYSVNAEASTRVDFYVPQGNYLVVQALAVNKIGYLTFEWLEYPEAPND